ncbi:MAG: alkaline phosphatase D family protein [Pirellulaceae bacterium]
MLGRAQVDDLKRDLLDAENNGVTEIVMMPELIQQLGAIAEDRYEGYFAERTELLQHIHEMDIENVVFVSADIHGTVVNNLSYPASGIPCSDRADSAWATEATGPVAHEPAFGPYLLQVAFGAGTNRSSNL